MTIYLFIVIYIYIYYLYIYRAFTASDGKKRTSSVGWFVGI